MAAFSGLFMARPTGHFAGAADADVAAGSHGTRMGRLEAPPPRMLGARPAMEFRGQGASLSLSQASIEVQAHEPPPPPSMPVRMPGFRGGSSSSVSSPWSGCSSSISCNAASQVSPTQDPQRMFVPGGQRRDFAWWPMPSETQEPKEGFRWNAPVLVERIQWGGKAPLGSADYSDFCCFRGGRGVRSSCTPIVIREERELHCHTVAPELISLLRRHGVEATEALVSDLLQWQAMERSFGPVTSASRLEQSSRAGTDV